MATRVRTYSAFDVISRDDFRKGVEAAIDRGGLRPWHRWYFRKHLKDPRRFEKLYGRMVAKAPVKVYASGKLDFEAFLEWLLENLPTILQLLATLLAFI